MMNVPEKALWRAESVCVNKSRIAMLLARLRHLWQRRKHPHIRDITAAQARDIGLPPPQAHRWPSQHNHPPQG
ncbi:MAG: hypothetical protein ACJAVM_001955 [Sulfitobacter sp.]|jgi:hypothetical protein